MEFAILRAKKLYSGKHAPAPTRDIRNEFYFQELQKAYRGEKKFSFNVGEPGEKPFYVCERAFLMMIGLIRSNSQRACKIKPWLKAKKAVMEGTHSYAQIKEENEASYTDKAAHKFNHAVFFIKELAERFGDTSPLAGNQSFIIIRQ